MKAISYGPYDHERGVLWILERCSKMIRHRGPDWNGIHCDKNCVIAHERLAIVGVSTGAQASFQGYLEVHIYSFFVNGLWLFSHMQHTICTLFENHSKPIRNKQSTMFLSVNGEIYNYLSIKEQLIAENPEFENEFVSDSDCEPVMYLYKKYG